MFVIAGAALRMPSAAKACRGVERRSNMKVEIGSRKPEVFREYWPGQYEFFSHLEYACGIPHVLFVITTVKENGKPNACFHSWSAFAGDEGGFFAVMPGLGQDTHTYKNIMRTGEFCVNFLGPYCYDACMKTIHDNSDDADELAVGGFGAEKSVSISAPRIAESFLSLECTLESATDLSGKGITSLVVGRVVSIAADENCAKGLDEKYGPNGFMFNIHAPKNLTTGEGDTTAVAALSVLRTVD